MWTQCSLIYVKKMFIILKNAFCMCLLNTEFFKEYEIADVLQI